MRRIRPAGGELQSELRPATPSIGRAPESLAAEKRQTALEREAWNEELRQLRRTLERQTEAMAHAISPAAPPREAHDPNRASPVEGRSEIRSLTRCWNNSKCCRRTRFAS